MVAVAGGGAVLVGGAWVGATVAAGGGGVVAGEGPHAANANNTTKLKPRIFFVFMVITYTLGIKTMSPIEMVAGWSCASWQ